VRRLREAVLELRTEAVVLRNERESSQFVKAQGLARMQLYEETLTATERLLADAHQRLHAATSELSNKNFRIAELEARLHSKAAGRKALEDARTRDDLRDKEVIALRARVHLLERDHAEQQQFLQAQAQVEPSACVHRQRRAHTHACALWTQELTHVRARLRAAVVDRVLAGETTSAPAAASVAVAPAAVHMPVRTELDGVAPRPRRLSAGVPGTCVHAHTHTHTHTYTHTTLQELWATAVAQADPFLSGRCVCPDRLVDGGSGSSIGGGGSAICRAAPASEHGQAHSCTAGQGQEQRGPPRRAVSPKRAIAGCVLIASSCAHVCACVCMYVCMCVCVDVDEDGWQMVHWTAIWSWCGRRCGPGRA
jgi:hypothetical protein